MKTTLSILKADVGSIGGHTKPSQRMMDSVRAEYDRQLDATFSAARGFVDAVVLPEELRGWLTLLLRAALNNPGPHIGPFVLPPELGARSR